jgi:tetratricopeptide (TPR) repeat protein
MFSLCVAGDPGNAIYLQSLLVTLRKKYAGKKAGGLAGLFAGGGGRSLKKLALNAQWRDVIKQGVEIIKTNPTDHTCLLAMAEACGNLMMVDAQNVYLRAALDASPGDAEVNRQCARFAANQGHFDQAIECWRRISKLKGLAEEADREIARLSVEKTISAGQGMLGRAAAGGKPGAAAANPEAAAPGGNRLAELKQAIRDNPAAVDSYLELADLLEREGTIAEAEQVLVKALAASGNEIRVREHVEDRQLRWARINDWRPRTRPTLVPRWRISRPRNSSRRSTSTPPVRRGTRKTSPGSTNWRCGSSRPATMRRRSVSSRT